jgi:hypothetical protein
MNSVRPPLATRGIFADRSGPQAVGLGNLTVDVPGRGTDFVIAATNTRNHLAA